MLTLCGQTNTNVSLCSICTYLCYYYVYLILRIHNHNEIMA